MNYTKIRREQELKDMEEHDQEATLNYYNSMQELGIEVLEK